MIVIAGLVLGAITGGITARKRKGSAADIAQYMAVYAIFFSLIGMIITVTIDKMV